MIQRVSSFVGGLIFLTCAFAFSIPTGYFPLGSTYFPSSFTPSDIDPRNGASVEMLNTKLALQYTDAVILGRGGLTFTLNRTLHYGRYPGGWVHEIGHSWVSMYTAPH